MRHMIKRNKFFFRIKNEDFVFYFNIEMSLMSVISCFPRLIIKFDAPIAVDQWILLAVDDK